MWRRGTEEVRFFDSQEHGAPDLPTIFTDASTDNGLIKKTE